LAEFHNVLFEEPEKTMYEVNKLSNVSFMNTEITRVRFSDEARWREKKVKEERFKILDERLLEEDINKKGSHTTKEFHSRNFVTFIDAS
jgi:hypothetical protein